MSTETAPFVEEPEAETAAAPQGELFEMPKMPVKAQDVYLAQIEEDERLLGDPSAEMVNSLADIGLLTPVFLQGPFTRVDGSPLYRVLDGARRVKACRRVKALLAKAGTLERTADLRIDPVPAMVAPAGYAVSQAITLITNYLRSGNPVRDFGALVEELKRPGATAETVAKRLHLTVRDVRRLTALLGLNDTLREAFMAERIAPGLARSIAKFSPAKQAQVVTLLESLKPGEKLHGNEVSALFQKDAVEAIAALPFDEVFGSPEAPEAPPATADDVRDFGALLENVQTALNEREERITKAMALLGETPASKFTALTHLKLMQILEGSL